MGGRDSKGKCCLWDGDLEGGIARALEMRLQSDQKYGVRHESIIQERGFHAGTGDLNLNP
jgi:hypothetical protein